MAGLQNSAPCREAGFRAAHFATVPWVRQRHATACEASGKAGNEQEFLHTLPGEEFERRSILIPNELLGWLNKHAPLFFDQLSKPLPPFLEAVFADSENEIHPIGRTQDARCSIGV
jgi:hypothetical protein